MSDLPTAQTRAAIKLLLSMLNGTAHVRDALPRASLLALLDRMAVGSLREIGVPLHPTPSPADRTAPWGRTGSATATRRAVGNPDPTGHDGGGELRHAGDRITDLGGPGTD